MNKSTSLYLDFLRVFAAFGVFLFHAKYSWFSICLSLSDQLGNKFVMIFFVLSGYLIAFTVDNKNKGSKKYLVDRLSRLYSVIFPALVLTFILDFIGKHFNPNLYSWQITPHHQIFRYIANITFIGQIWGLSVKPSSNGPFWSISYEFWYYMLFWAYHYIGGRKKYVSILLVCLIIGPKILLLLPVWLFGVVAYKGRTKLQMKPFYAWLLFLSTLMSGVILTFFWDFSFFKDRFIEGRAPLYFSYNFIFDWVLGAIIALNIFSFSFFTFKIKAPRFLGNMVKKLSAMTFSLYLFHFPIMLLVASLVRYDRANIFQVSLVLTGIVIIVYFLSRLTENKRHYWKDMIDKVFNYLESKMKINLN